MRSPLISLDLISRLTGMATPTHTPEGRGFNSSLIYYEHKVRSGGAEPDAYEAVHCASSTPICPQSSPPQVDFDNQGIMQTDCLTSAPGTIDLWDSGGPARSLNGTGYADDLFTHRVLSIIRRHDWSPGGPPLFILFTPHAAHCPLQVPRADLARLNSTIVPSDETLCSAQTPYIFPGSTAADFRCRAQYETLVALLDANVGKAVDELRNAGVWNETLMFFSSDNGGPLVLDESGANNHPLRGGKYSWWEGGTRAAAFVSGGYLPPAVRGSVLQEPLHLTDMYATYGGLAGLPDPTADPVAAAAGLPPVDSLDMWPLLSGANATSPRTELPLSPTAFISGRYKLLLGAAEPYATWTGERYPNATSPAHRPGDANADCATPGGCLFDVVADPTEHVDVAAAHPDIVAAMKARLGELAKGFYSNNDTGVDACPPGISVPCACYLALPGNKWNGFFGPFQY
jgi:hypothetical protein